MRKIFTKIIIIFLMIFGLSQQNFAQMDICVSVSHDSLVFKYKSKKDYLSAPTFFWNSQLVTVRYPKTIALTWGGIDQLSTFEWEEDPNTPGIGLDGNDGFIYKTFYSSNTPNIALKKDIFYTVFKVKFNAKVPFTFEPITNTALTQKLHLDAAVNNAVEPGPANDGNIFNAFLNCGTLLFNDVVDGDGDGYVGVNDPDDKDPCVPKGITITNVKATDMTDCATKDGKIKISTVEKDAFSYSIDNGLTFKKDSIFSNLNKGIYQIVVKSQFGCYKTYPTKATIKCDSTLCLDKIAPTFTLVHPIIKNRKSGDSITMYCGYEFPLIENQHIIADDNVDKNLLVKVKEKTIINLKCLNRTRYVWEAIDKCGNIAQFVLYATVKDTTPPELIGIPGDMTVADTKNLPALPTVSAVDKCSAGAIIDYEEKFSDTLITRIWKVRDECGNLAIKKQNIFIAGGPKLVTTPDTLVVDIVLGETRKLDVSSKEIGSIVRMEVRKFEKFNEAVNFQMNYFDGKTTEIFGNNVGHEEITYVRFDKKNNCDLLTVKVNVIPPYVDPDGDNELVIYNAFSPNGDGVNETFTIKNVENYQPNHLIILNRWGNIVFEGDNYLNTWDGTNNGKNLPVGTYFYKFQIGKKRIYAGFVELKR